MLKFWKKKPGEESRATEKPAEPAPEVEQTPPSQAVEVQINEVAESEITPAAEIPIAPDNAKSVLSEWDSVEIQSLSAPSRGAAQPAKGSWRDRLSGSGFAKGLGSLFARNPILDDDLLDELETCLITADVGINASTEIVDALRKRVGNREFADANALLDALRQHLVKLLKPVEQALDVSGQSPFVILMVGVNGVGKTTTIGKLARRYLDEKRSVMLAAGDTFRAAAVEQLQTWGQRNNVPVIAQVSGADSASVIFDALQAARSRRSNVLIADTAGRLHTQSGLMDELSKIRRVLAKIDNSTPHEVLMVIDGTTGQNAIAQLKHFREAIGVSGLVVTKLDGTAKGGVVFALAREFGLPIRFIGLGEGIEDLRVFDAQAFVDGLLPASLANASAGN